MSAIDDDEEIETIRQRAIERLYNCIRLELCMIARSFETCGKAACARARRCRGFACEPQEEK